MAFVSYIVFSLSQGRVMGNTIIHTTDCNDEKAAEQTLIQAYAVS